MNINRILAGIVLLSSLMARADSLPVGVISFDNFIAATPQAAGVNAFNLNNYTGSSALPPDFPSSTALTFQNASLTLTFSDSSSTVVPLGDIASGLLSDGFGNPLAALQFTDMTNFEKGVFSATLNQTTFLLSDGSSFTTDSANISTSLLPSSGQYLSAGTDSAVITTSGSSFPVSPVPEPGTLTLIETGFLGFIGLAINSRVKGRNRIR